jgi:hypothetical protein
MAGPESPSEWEEPLKERYPMLRYFTSNPFGVEIELFGLQFSISAGDAGIIPPYKIMNRNQAGLLLPQVFKEQGLCLNGFSREEPPYEGWSFVTDDTIKGAGGSELVSPILYGLPGLAQVFRVFKTLQAFDQIQVNETCGFHVHHGVEVETYGDRELARLVKIIAMIENYIYCLLPEDRSHLDTCRPLEVDINELLHPRGSGGEIKPPRIKKLWYSEKNRSDPEKPPLCKYHPTRYHGLNLHSYWYRGTIEFRYFPSLLDKPEEMMQWIIFTQFLVEMGRGRYPRLEYLPEANKWLNTLYKIYAATGRLWDIEFPKTAAEN